jgi:hypothetical protein
MEAPPPVVRDGRTLGWRVGMLLAGAVVAGAGVALFVWPWLLSWMAGAVLAALGAVLLVSAVAARGR